MNKDEGGRSLSETQRGAKTTQIYENIYFIYFFKQLNQLTYPVMKLSFKLSFCSRIRQYK